MPNCFKHSPDTTASDNARTDGSRFEQDDGAAHFGCGLVRNGCLGKMDLMQIFAGAISGFTHGIGYCVGFANSHANLAVIIAHDQRNTELKNGGRPLQPWRHVRSQ